ncbi:MAG: hypothetical protein KJZ80_06450 [Hyphomicrobiaceae bacterium]|nr:hypothetical protein [Hyphomicrobiaceae bacterium]
MTMVAWKRFPVPEFKHEEFKDMAYTAPAAISPDDGESLRNRHKAGDASLYGGYVASPGKELLERFQIRGELAHAVMCVLPQQPTHLLGRSWAWKIQRALVLDSLDAASARVMHDWKTPRPMNTRLGPDDGVTLPGGICYVITASKYADHWLGNRSIIQANWAAAEGRAGFRVLGSSDPDASDFHHTYLAFDWPA